MYLIKWPLGVYFNNLTTSSDARKLQLHLACSQPTQGILHSYHVPVIILTKLHVLLMHTSNSGKHHYLEVMKSWGHLQQWQMFPIMPGFYRWFVFLWLDVGGFLWVLLLILINKLWFCLMLTCDVRGLCNSITVRFYVFILFEYNHLYTHTPTSVHSHINTCCKAVLVTSVKGQNTVQYTAVQMI